MTTPLSPAPQAVWGAFNDAYETLGPLEDMGQPIAAALRAAADQVISSVPPPCADFDEYAKGFLAAHVKYRRDFLAIATELESDS